MIKMNMIDLMRFSDVNKKKYDDKIEVKKREEFERKELSKIAQGLRMGLSKDRIAASLQKPCGQSTLYERIKLIKNEYPELLEENSGQNTGIPENSPEKIGIPEDSGQEPEKSENDILYTSDFKF